jgi:CubicO group peptidase (beta-lactamase class C family)
VIPADTVKSLMEQFAVPGVAVGLRHGEDEEVAGFGVTSVENPLDVDGDTLVQIGSITKTFTATAAVRLAEDGRLDLDEPVRTYLPELRLADEATAAAVTMRHLLSHTGGWVGDYFDTIGRGDDVLAQMVARLDRLEQLTPLGQTWSYNNAGFYIAGRVIEIVTGEPYEDAQKELVLDPLGLERSFFFADDVITHRFVVGHRRDGEVARPWPIGRPSAAVGGIVSSVRELLGYARVQLRESDLLSAESVAEMRRPHAEVVGVSGADAVGLGWYLFEREGRSFVIHGGATLGQQARLVIGPEERFALAVLTNHDDGGALAGELQEAVFREAFGFAPATPVHIERSREELAGYAGSYEAPLTRLNITVDGDGLLLEMVPRGGFPTPDSPPPPGPPPTRLAFEAPDLVVALDPPARGMSGDFLRGPDGEIAWFRLGGRLHRPAR